MSIPGQVMAGFAAWFAAVVAYLVGVFITIGKPSEAYARSFEGKLRYDVGPMISILLALGLVILGICLFGHAAYRKLARRG
jgi:hypothetical protein